ncbi:unnamed protein product [Enterobius vermicularis]|uniref:Thyroglobulin type-1 domain-containing protein n=1 Tax=Enterobius vermicularis TaxID=51028 RepID=A0A0N4UZK2_ENTVE|nr:unnamed protein product [Enterobius vermicularis]
MGEYCASDGFCCLIQSNKELPMPLLSSVNKSSNSVLVDKSQPCPDGSNWMRKCATDSDCNSKDELCAEGKCCAVCSQRRRQVLDELPTTNVLGVYLPKCTNDGKFYRPRQCRIGTDTCFCVNTYGRTIAMVYENNADDKDVCITWRNLIIKNNNSTIHDETVCGANEVYVSCFDPCQPTCNALNRKACRLDTCVGGCHCREGYVRVGSNPQAVCVPASQCIQYTPITADQCTDPLKEYSLCGSACPISCATRTVPQNECTERCVAGCFCRIPYILENGRDPQNSRCILPAQCPLDITIQPSKYPSDFQTSNSVTQPNRTPNFQVPIRDFRFPISINYFNPPAHYNTLSANVRGYPCTDPLKNFLICGSSCPVGCNNRVAKTCGTQCESGCFCRPPYILKDASNLNSGCVLPEKCPAVQVPQQTCVDPRKQWVSCQSSNCNPSCSNPTGTCQMMSCKPGCVCREPYILKDHSDSNSRCILPSECPLKSQCDDPLKEFRYCASSCPMGCNNRNPKTCTPCVSGCFCKLGYCLFRCVQKKTEPWVAYQVAKQKFCFCLQQSSKFSVIQFIVDDSDCPKNTADNNGKLCNSSWDCPTSQKCCPLTNRDPGSWKERRCTCSDPHAIWNSCGSLCPEYCGEPSIPVCSETCNPGCHCAPGYVRARNDINAPCVLRSQCIIIVGSGESEESPQVPRNPFEDEQIIAVVFFNDAEKKIFGKLSVASLKNNKVKIFGNFNGLPFGEHAVVIHQSGDVSNSCKNIGLPLRLDNSTEEITSVGNVKVAENTTVVEISKILDWPDAQMIAGRSVAVHSTSIDDFSNSTAMANNSDTVITCGTVGVVSR